MTKIKSPLLSLSASKQIAREITFRRSRGQNIASVSKPPTYRRTLPQLKQRWLFSDARWWWHSLSQSQKDSYRSGASRAHMTAYAYAIRYYLRNLPDVAARWYFDEPAGNIAYDASPNANNGTIVGAQHQPGLFGNCLSFDGLDDYVRVPHSSSVSLTNPLTLEATIFITGWGESSYPRILDKYADAYRWALIESDSSLYFDSYTAPFQVFSDPNAISLDHWLHTVITYDLGPGSAVRFYVDGLPVGFTLESIAVITSSDDLYIANDELTARSFLGLIDQITLYNRALSPQQILEHANRRPA